MGRSLDDTVNGPPRPSRSNATVLAPVAWKELREKGSVRGRGENRLVDSRIIVAKEERFTMLDARSRFLFQTSSSARYHSIQHLITRGPFTCDGAIKISAGPLYCSTAELYRGVLGTRMYCSILQCRTRRLSGVSLTRPRL